MNVAIFLARTLAYLQRFCVAWENFGLLSAIRLFYYSRLKSLPNGVSLPVRRLRRNIVFRGKMDKGVLSHFYGPGYRILDSAANPVRVIIDAGANIGDETLRFRHFHPDAQIVAIEPDSGNYSILSRNVSADQGIHVLKSGLWSHECKLRVTPGVTAEAFRVEEVDNEPQPGDVDAVSISSIMTRFSFNEIDILKMDIEGAEYEVFSSPEIDSWIGRVKVFIFECPDADRMGATQRIFEKLANLEFKCHIIGECFVLIRRDAGWALVSNTYL